MGVIETRRRRMAKGMFLLQKAVETASPSDGPGVAEVQADLGLTMLIQGQREEGLQWLQSARQGFADTGDRHGLLQCLANEMKYHERFGDRKRLKPYTKRYSN